MASEGMHVAEQPGEKPLGAILGGLILFGVTAWGYLDHQTNLYADWWQDGSEWMIVRVENVSISKHIALGLVDVNCPRGTTCVPAYDSGTDMENFSRFLLEPDATVSDMQYCAAPGGFLRFSFNLLPGEFVMVHLKASAADVRLQFHGQTQGPCATANPNRDAYFLTNASMFDSSKAFTLRHSRKIAGATALMLVIAFVWFVGVPLMRKRRHAVRRRR